MQVVVVVVCFLLFFLVVFRKMNGEYAVLNKGKLMIFLMIIGAMGNLGQISGLIGLLVGWLAGWIVCPSVGYRTLYSHTTDHLHLSVNHGICSLEHI